MRYLSMLVVYRRPLDFPEHFVVRENQIWPNGVLRMANVACLYNTLDEARTDMMRFGLVRLDRSPEDEPHIVEVWL